MQLVTGEQEQIGAGKKSYDDIEKHLLVELSYAGTYGATGKHVEQLLDKMVKDGDIKQGETFYPAPPQPEAPSPEAV